MEGYIEGTELREGDHKSFKCSTVAGNPPAKLRWYRGENEVSDMFIFQGIVKI